ncbi:hypothetical protein AGABI2DRAFT_116129 [Agaricus bisporus var. bisporus H97]|uniref:hypothetical protein n=1 Tax=Agaricus bisporus var. bisporus (strain H97 / ATCC MYA-4626 / FGSC 10389) TaxID=936046 RepID=UPI00029F5F50|nr:hypothetical protein AGABI2DRAFT_116129 [Agaricus bisporus var. bisporus H97]EKV49087.1 hypothetical protein AGABI2DRAFT_116129 [Agaricus bisporus var. bisporus H97]
MVEQEQRIHFQGIQDSPVKMWEALEAVHRQKRAGMRFNAYDDLFSIRKLEEESLQSLINRVESSKRKIKELRPSSFTLEQLDDELASMALIRALPDAFSGFTSSLLLMDKLDKTTVHQAFVTEDLQRKKRAQDSSTTEYISILIHTSGITTRSRGFLPSPVYRGPELQYSIYKTVSSATRSSAIEKEKKKKKTDQDIDTYVRGPGIKPSSQAIHPT